MEAKPTIEELEQETAYEKVLTLSYNDLAPFVINNLKSLNLPIILTWSVMTGSLAMTIIFWPGVRYSMENPGLFEGLAYGLLLIPLLLVPVHELLHLIPYRLAGAKDIRVGADLRQGIIYVTAHRFVAGRKLFSLVGFTPFILISTGLIITILLCTPWLKWILSLSLFVHTTMCAGDAVLIGFMRGFRHRKVFTWDDAESMKAYFYAEKEKYYAV
jgi:hypothetical protein